MRIYAAGAMGCEQAMRDLLDPKGMELGSVLVDRLVSYVYMTTKLLSVYRHMAIHESTIMLDSGAFTAWTKKQTIDVDTYGTYAVSVLDWAQYIVNLDVLPGEFGKKYLNTAAMTNASAEAGLANAERLVELGVPRHRLIPVFHQDESFGWLEAMRDAGYSYIGLSPANDRKVREKMQWLDECMAYVTEEDGSARIAFHGFAVTSLPLILRYPWASVDSSTWCVFSGNGGIFVPCRRDGQWVFDMDPLKLAISAKSPNVKEKGKHYQTARPGLQKMTDDWLEELGFTAQEAAEDHLVRYAVNAIYFGFLADHLTANPQAFQPRFAQPTFF